MGASIGLDISGVLPGQDNLCENAIAPSFKDWADGWCDDGLNSAACGWDGGDCCRSTYVHSWNTDGPCLDPDTLENGGLSLRVSYTYMQGPERLEVTVKGARPGAVLALAGSRRPPSSFVVPEAWGPDVSASGDVSSPCGGFEIDLVPFFSKTVLSSDDNATVTMSLTGQELGIDRHALGETVAVRTLCSHTFQVIESTAAGCRKSNLAFARDLRHEFWTPNSCSDHGFCWCDGFASYQYYGDDDSTANQCCQDCQYWCDVPVNCPAGSKGFPTYQTDEKGPDACIMYWLTPGEFDQYFGNSWG